MTMMTAIVIFRDPDGAVLGTSTLTGGWAIGCQIPPGATTMDVTAVVTSSGSTAGWPPLPNPQCAAGDETP